MQKACIFDLDGTLVDSMPSIAYFANRALTYYGLLPYEEKEYHSMVGWGAKHLVWEMLKRQGIPETQTDLFDKVFRMYHDDYEENPSYLTVPYPHMVEIMEKLSEMGFALGVFSNKPHETTRRIVKELFPAAYENCFGGRPGVPKKPDPTVLLELLKTLDILPQNCLYFGDSEPDILMGHRAGVKTHAVLWGYRTKAQLQEAGATIFLTETQEILTLCEKEQN